MNGTLTATYRGRITRSSTMFSLRHGTTINWNEGDEVDVREDHYGNTYIEVDGVDETCFHLDRIGDITWHTDGLVQKIAECDRILTIHSGPDGNADVRARVTEDRNKAIDLLLVAV